MRHIAALIVLLATALSLPPLARAQSTSAVARKSAPSVVAIEVVSSTTPFPRRDVPDDTMSASWTVTPKGTAAGSGTLISPDGLIVTSASLLDHPGDIRVTLYDGTRMEGKVVGTDQRSGIALIRVPGSGLPYLTPAPQASVQLGVSVVAMGRAFIEPESFPTVTEGIVSATTDAKHGYAPLIQSTAQTLPNMGGGPLLLVENGAFVGINGLRFVSRTSAYSITFSSPVTEYARISNELIQKGFVERAVIGVSAAPLSEDTRVQLGLAKGAGVLLTAVRPDGPAAKAGLLVGDIVLAIDRTTVSAVGELFQAIDSQRAGSKLSVRYFRRGIEATVQIESELQQRR